MVELDCDRCGTHVEADEHWVHVSVFHHDRLGNPKRWSKDDPENYAMGVCPDCAEEMGL